MSSKIPASSQIASTRAKLYKDEALSNDDPSWVTVCELCADAKNVYRFSLICYIKGSTDKAHIKANGMQNRTESLGSVIFEGLANIS